MNEPLTMTIPIDLARRLRDVGCGRLAHINRGYCPYDSSVPIILDRRDSTCPACKVLCEADAAIDDGALAIAEPCPPAILKRRGMLSAPEIADLAGLNLKTVHNHAAAGHLVGTLTAGRRRRFSATAARDYIRTRVSHVPAWLDALAAGEAASS